ncbi:dihydroneopterin aldolase domain protein [Aspergillus affinis]|uniref:dihydroneopterin aldolase domain protein n=1 Tax=Aspergillus affinis TaxID=1070780 RepID=UPI0022FDC74A|nr:dihydroneopterin aldolase domain protein [Aspergillus affinis]KAI9036823.1 dihydroneopterin aldolase domain protein [Aspergillus affinis]
MSQSTSSIQTAPQPSTIDTIQLRDIQIHLPRAPDAWHRPGTTQPCSASLRLSYSSSIAAAEADDVSRTIDYGKLFRRITQSMRKMNKTSKLYEYTLENYIMGADEKPLQDTLRGETGQDVRLFAAIMAESCLEILVECAVSARFHFSFSSVLYVSIDYVNERQKASPQSTAIRTDYGEFELRLHLPKAILRAAGGLWHRGVFVMRAIQEQGRTARRLILLEEEFEIREIRSFCILGVNPWEKLEKQAVNISLKFKGPGGHKWGSTVVDTYQAMSRDVAERVEKTSFQSVEALASFVARIVTMDHGNDKVTVLVEKHSALAFVGGSGLDITRSRAFYLKT